jgi:hypothetical protein
MFRHFSLVLFKDYFMISREQLTVPEYFKKYINAVKENDPVKALKNNSRRFQKVIKQIPKNKRDFAYAEGKWTIRQLFQHIIDTERVFVFRSLWFARKDISPLPGFDENAWASDSRAVKRKWNEMLEEFKIVREATILLFESFNKEQLMTTGVSNNNLISVAALGYVTSGHIEHHMKMIKTRYLPSKKTKNKRPQKTEEKDQGFTLPVQRNFPKPDEPMENNTNG